MLTVKDGPGFYRGSSSYQSFNKIFKSLTMDATATKKALLSFLLGAFFLQAVPDPVAAQSSIEGNNFDKTIRIYDANGRAMVNSSIDAQGSPLFLPNWKLGWIRLVDNRFFTAVPLRLDLEQ